MALREQLHALAPDDVERATQLANGYAALAGLLWQENLREDARAVLEKARSTLESLPADRAGDATVLESWMLYYSGLAPQWRATGDMLVLRDARRQQLLFAERIAAGMPAGSVQQRNLALASKYYGAALQELGERTAAREQYDRALAIDRQSLDAEPQNPNRKLDLSFSHASIGALLRGDAHLEGALDAYRQAVRLRQEVFAADPDNEFAFRSLVRGHQSLADVFARRGDLARAAQEEQEAPRIRERWEETHASPYGGAALKAGWHESLGGHLATLAAAARTPGTHRRAYWLRAKWEYTRALEAWTAIAAAKPLQGELAARPRELQQALARCEAALAAR